jgi:lipopolysaccharide export system permease protein
MIRARILDRYIFRELVPPFFLTEAALLLVFMLQQLFRISDLIVSKGATIAGTLKVLLYVMPGFLVFTMPMSLLIAVLTVFARLSADSEITAMKSSGIGLFSLVRPVLLFAVLCCAATAYTSLSLVPAANTALNEHLFSLVKSQAMVGIEPGVFSTTFDGMVVYVDKMKSLDDMNGVFIYDERSEREPYAIVAKSGALVADPQAMSVTLSLREGTIHSDPGKAATAYSMMRFASSRLFLDISSALVRNAAPGRNYEDMGYHELIDSIGTQRREGKPVILYETELHKRLALPFACLLFGLISAPLGIRRSRSGKSAGIVIAVLVFLFYYLLLGSIEKLARTGAVPPLQAYWIPNAIVLGLSFLFVLKKGLEVDWGIERLGIDLYYGTKLRAAALLRRKRGL